MRSRSLVRAFTLNAALVVIPAVAQTTAPKPAPTTVPEKIAPGAEPSAPAENLSKKLNQSGGVIHPQTNVDPAMNKGAPGTGDPNVIPPPAKGGGKEGPQAK